MSAAKEHFDAVVVGSGFGGSVMAYRLAASNYSVCLLERGRPYPPGSFPRRPDQACNNFWSPKDGRYGLFDTWSFRHMDAVVSSGLGGGSLIYANVLIRKDEKWFVRDGQRGGSYEYWPLTRTALDPHYDTVERMLGAQAYPFSQQPYSATPKTRAMQEAARRLGIAQATHDTVDSSVPQWYLPLLAVSFSSNGRTHPGLPISGDNLHDAPRQTCRLCGQCDVGCNYGAKNTLDYNYLTQAKNHGADIRARCEMSGFTAHASGTGYDVDFWNYEGVEDGVKDGGTAGRVSGTMLILACGTLATNLAMLKHRRSCAGVSATAGTRFSGNGDLITFAFNCGDRGKAKRKIPMAIDGSYGPVITSTFRFPDSRDDGSAAGPGMYLQEAGYPLLIDWVTEAFNLRGNAVRASRILRGFASRLLGTNDPEIGRALADAVGPSVLSSSSLAMLGVGRDRPSGRLGLRTLKKGRLVLDLDWSRDLSRSYFSRASTESRKVGRILGGFFVPDPLTRLFNRLITVHPLGGCAMGRTIDEGVVDENGEVWNHPNLFIADGSVMPGPVGANPSLTIAAIADRIADAIIARGPATKANGKAACVR